MEEKKPIFNLCFTYEEALQQAEEFQKSNPELRIWKDPRNYAGERMNFELDGIDAKYWDDLKEDVEFGEIDKGAKAALLWLIDRHRGFNSLELGQVIVGKAGLCEDRKVAIFTFLSRESDCLRAFIEEKGYDLTER